MEFGRMTSPEIRDLEDKERVVIVIPVGATEQHGRHLPLQVDSVLVGDVAQRAASSVSEETHVYVTPTFWLGCSDHHMDFAGTLGLSQETFTRAMTELGMCFVRHGFKKLLFLNGHSYNLPLLQVAIRSIRDATDGSVIAATANYWQFIPEAIEQLRGSPIGGMAHACEFETSAMLAIAPEQVDMKQAVRHMPTWNTPYFVMDLAASRRVIVAHHVADLSPSGVFGDATIATVEKGEGLLEAAGSSIAKFIDDFSTWEFGTL